MRSVFALRVSRVVLSGALVLLMSVAAAAQTQVRVVKDQATVWGREAHVPLTTVKAGTVLDVVGREGAWYIVVVPKEVGGRGQTGMIAVSQVEVVGGTAGTPAQRPPAAVRRAPAPPPRPVQIFGVAQAGLSAWLAHDTFAAVTGHSYGPLFGGGIEVRVHRHLFIQGSAEWYEKTGHRTFVANGQSFDLGIRDTVRIIPVSVSAGYRHEFRPAAAYVGGGVGRYFYKETSDFADPSENLDTAYTSYLAVGGIELGHSWWRTAFEVQYTSVPNALGSSGAAAAFNEHNLGGVQFRVKFLAGR